MFIVCPAVFPAAGLFRDVLNAANGSKSKEAETGTERPGSASFFSLTLLSVQESFARSGEWFPETLRRSFR